MTDGIVERINYQPDNLFYREHEARYQFALPRLLPGPTLDIACGTGYGTHMLSRATAATTIGVDLYVPSLEDALRQSVADAYFLAGNGQQLPFGRAAFGNIVCLETLEHVADAHAFLAELKRVLRPGGVLVLSTPNRLYSEEHHVRNPYHVREYGEAELRQLLGQFFTRVDLFYQGFSARYHAEVHGYANEIQARKRRLNVFMRLLIDRVYRPLRAFVPTRFTNYVIRRYLGIRYPSPQSTDITIAQSLPEMPSVLMAVCQG